jgi:xanthine/CO dehydrogenase XdhC/CoxF family maturation factor
MSHNYSNDLRFLESIITSDVRYIGLLGPVHRKEQLLNAIFETNLDIVETVFEKIHGPVGLAIGSESPEEVSLSIMAEIISIFKSSIINQ